MKLAKIILCVGLGLIFLGQIGEWFGLPVGHGSILNLFLIFVGVILSGLAGGVAIFADHYFPDVK